MLFIAAVAFYLSLVALAGDRNVVALGLAVSIAGLSVVFVIYAVTYWLCYGIASAFFDGKRQAESEFENEKRARESL